MLPGNGIGDADKTCFTTDAQYRFEYQGHGVPLNTNDIKEYIRNPHKFNLNTDMDGVYYNLWSTDNDKTVPNDDVVIKSVYDPSPVGYSLPASNAFTGFTTTGGNINNNFALFNVKEDFDKGWDFYSKQNKQGETVFFPAPGYRLYGVGSLNSVTAHGHSWVAGPFNTSLGYYLSFYSSDVSPLYRNYRSYGFSLRSAEEKVLKCGLKKLQIVCNFGENCNITTLKICIFII